MDISIIPITACTIYRGVQTFTVPTTKTLTIETSPHGEEIFVQAVPVGKEWEVTVSVSIKEMDA